MDDEGVVEYYIKNSVKETTFKVRYGSLEVEDAIQNGVKQTKRSYDGSRKQRTKYVVENGVKDTKTNSSVRPHRVEDTIQNGAKITKTSHDKYQLYGDEVIQNGEKLN
jgi:predicted DNA binding protein